MGRNGGHNVGVFRDGGTQFLSWSEMEYIRLEMVRNGGYNAGVRDEDTTLEKV